MFSAGLPCVKLMLLKSINLTKINAKHKKTTKTKEHVDSKTDTNSENKYRVWVDLRPPWHEWLITTFSQGNVVNSTAHSCQYNQRWHRWILLRSDSPPEGSPVTWAPPPAVWPHLTPDCCQVPPGAEHERGGAAPRCCCSRWPNTHTYPRLMAWHWRGAACVRCCLRPLWPPKKDKLDTFLNVWNTLDKDKNKILQPALYTLYVITIKMITFQKIILNIFTQTEPVKIFASNLKWFKCVIRLLTTRCRQVT